jgi:hypothetical protein
MHAVQAGTFEELLDDGLVLANLPQTAFIDAAHCAFNGSVPGGTPAADAMYLAMYDVYPTTQGEWAAWLHLMATARGDLTLASRIADSGIRLPWTTQWTHWRPPGGFHLRYLEPGPVEDYVEVRWERRPAVAAVCHEDDSIRIWDLSDGTLLGGPWFGGGIPVEFQADLSWPDGDEQETAGPTSANDLVNACDPDDGPCELLLPWSLRIGNLVVLAGEGGLFAVAPSQPDAFQGPEPPRRDVIMRSYAGAGTTGPRDAPEPSPADLAELFGQSAIRRVAAEALPAGLTNMGARRVLTGLGLADMREQGLRLFPGTPQLLAEFSWPGELPLPDGVTLTGPFFLIGQWMGGRVAVEGGTGKVFRVPSGPDEDGLDGVLVAGSLEIFLTMVAQWIIGHRTLARVENSEETHLLRQAVADSLWILDREGGASNAWTYSLYND